MKTITDTKKIEEIFARGTVVDILPSQEEFKKKLQSGERLRMYIGVDPTGESLHLGHAKNIMFLEELRQLGHEVILLFGDFTAQIGDPTGKGTARTQLTAVEVKKNVTSWLDQVRPILNFTDKVNPALIKYNSEWLAKLAFADVVDLASNFTVQQMLERDMFKKRLKEGTPIHVHEFMYPLMQGYDSVAMDVDVEICGTDQTFNALAGRTLLKRYKNKDKYIVALNLIANPKTGELMSKSKGVGVLLNLQPNELFGSIMAQPDEMLEAFFLNCTRIPLDGKHALMALGPREAKARIAADIVKRFHGEAAAKTAEENFVATFAKGGVPDDVVEVAVKAGDLISEALVKAGIVASKVEWRRLVADGAVRTESDEKVADPFMKAGEGFLGGKSAAGKSVVLKVGKRRFVKLVVR